MIPQQQPQPDPLQPTSDELNAAWGTRLGQAIIGAIILDKLTAQMKSQIEAQAQNEARLQDHIQELEAKIAEFTQQEYDFVDHIQALESELEVMKTAERETDNPHAMSEAPEGRTIIAGAKEKAAPLRDGSANL